MDDMVGMTASTTCRYCGEASHVPADACLTMSDKVGQMVGKFLIGVLIIGLVIGTIVWLAANYS
jgi:hypothetical protein